MRELKGRVGVVTGAGSGIGRAAALALAAEGVALVLAGTTAARIEAVAAEILAAGGRATCLECDVAASDTFERLRDLALSRFGGIHLVMNNAAAISVGRPEDIPLDEWRRVFEINFMALVRSNHIFLPLLLAQGEGHLINTASVDGLFGFGYDRLPYATSKAAVVQLSEGLALYLRPHGIGVTCFCPGPFATDIASHIRIFGRSVKVHSPGKQFEMLPAAAAGKMIVDAIREDCFMVPSHKPETQAIVQRRAADHDRFVRDQIESPDVLFETEEQGSGNAR